MIKWGYDANIMKFFGPTGQSDIRDHAQALNFDLCQARKGDCQVCGKYPVVDFEKTC